jgi:iron-sulfur cluster repair protein YtfE (RIC family)
MRLEIPDVLKREHRELKLRLEAGAASPGPIGAASRKLLQLLEDHLKREEECAFPLLGLLPYLVEGTLGEEASVALPIADRLRTELGRLRQEHVAMVNVLEGLAEAARQENQEEYALLAHQLLEHARVEEAILYPAALVVGEYVRLRLSDTAAVTAGGERRQGERRAHR